MTDPVAEALRAGMAALLRGDTAERDRQVERAKAMMAAQNAKPQVIATGPEIVEKFLQIAEREAGRPLTERERDAITRNPAAFGKFLIERGYKIPADIAAGTFRSN